MYLVPLVDVSTEVLLAPIAVAAAGTTATASGSFTDVSKYEGASVAVLSYSISSATAGTLKPTIRECDTINGTPSDFASPIGDATCTVAATAPVSAAAVGTVIVPIGDIGERKKFLLASVVGAGTIVSVIGVTLLTQLKYK